MDVELAAIGSKIEALSVDELLQLQGKLIFLQDKISDRMRVKKDQLARQTAATNQDESNTVPVQEDGYSWDNWPSDTAAQIAEISDKKDQETA